MLSVQNIELYIVEISDLAHMDWPFWTFKFSRFTLVQFCVFPEDMQKPPVKIRSLFILSRLRVVTNLTLFDQSN